MIASFTAIDATENKQFFYATTVIEEQQKTQLLKAEEIATRLGLKVRTVYAMARREVRESEALKKVSLVSSVRWSGSSREKKIRY